jgi:hypothetical protein
MTKSHENIYFLRIKKKKKKKNQIYNVKKYILYLYPFFFCNLILCMCSIKYINWIYYINDKSVAYILEYIIIIIIYIQKKELIMYIYIHNTKSFRTIEKYYIKVCIECNRDLI